MIHDLATTVASQQETIISQQARLDSFATQMEAVRQFVGMMPPSMPPMPPPLVASMTGMIGTQHLQQGTALWGNRAYCVESIPSQMINSTHLKLQGTHGPGDVALTVTVNQAATIYVCFEAFSSYQARHGGFTSTLEPAGFTSLNASLIWGGDVGPPSGAPGESVGPSECSNNPHSLVCWFKDVPQGAYSLPTISSSHCPCAGGSFVGFVSVGRTP